MTPMKQKDCEDLANALKVLGWSPCMGKVMSFGEVIGHKIGVLVKVGDDRLKWMEPSIKPKQEEDQIDHIGLSNFFASAHVVAKNRPLDTQPVGFSSTMAGADTVEIAPGANESLRDFLNKIRKISTLHVQIDLFSFESSATPPAAIKVSNLGATPASAPAALQPNLFALHDGDAERTAPRMRL